MTSKSTLTFLSMFLLLCGSYSSFAQEGKQYRIGVFPCGGVFYSNVEERIARSLQTSIQRDPASTLAYSYYDDLLSEPRIKNPDRLWVGGEARKKPNLNVVYTLARERELDGVVMYWGREPLGSGQPLLVSLYLIDVTQHRVYRQKGTDQRVKNITNRVLTDFIKGRPTVVQTKAVQTIQSESLAGGGQQTDRTTAYRFGLFPVTGKMSRQLASSLVTSIKKNRTLVFTYSYYNDALNEPRIKNRDRLWVGGEIGKKPNLELVYELARERELDGVIMMSGTGVDASFGKANIAKPITFYLIDVEQRKVYRGKVTKEAHVDKITKRVVADFAKHRPQVRLAKAAETIQPESLAGGGQQIDRSTPYRIGVFPCGGQLRTGSIGDQTEQIVRSLQISIQRDRALTFVYSYYDDLLSEPHIKNPDRLWAKGAVQKKPNVDVVSALARERELDGVVMCWGTHPVSYGKPLRVWLYLTDVAQRKVYTSKGTSNESDVKKMAKAVFADFVKHRPQARLAKASGSAQPVVAKHTISTPGGVTLARGTFVLVELIENINTKYSNAGELVYLSVTADVKVGDKVAIPRGALVKAKIGAIKKHKTFGRAGDLSFHPVAVAALDGQWVSLVQESFGAEGAGPTLKGILGIGIIAKGSAAFVLRGTEYEVIVDQDAVIDTGKRKPLASLRNADFQTTARFRSVKQKIKFTRGGSGSGFVLDITLTPDITSLVQQKPSTIEIVEILDYVLHKPIKSIKVVLNPKKNNFISATFSWWSIVKHAQPGYTPMTVQLKLSDGRLAQAQAALDSEWKLE